MGDAQARSAASARGLVDVARTIHATQRGGTSGGGAFRSSHAPMSGVTRTMATAVRNSPAPQSSPSSRIADSLLSPSEREGRGGHDGREERRAPGRVAGGARRVDPRVALPARVEHGGVDVHAGVHADADDDRREGDGDGPQPRGSSAAIPVVHSVPSSERRQHREQRAQRSGT